MDDTQKHRLGAFDRANLSTGILLHAASHTSRHASGRLFLKNNTNRGHSLFAGERQPDLERLRGLCSSIATRIADYLQEYFFVPDCSCCIKLCVDHKTAPQLAVRGDPAPDPPGNLKDPAQSLYVWTFARDARSGTNVARVNRRILYRADSCSPFIWLTRDAEGEDESRWWVSRGNLEDPTIRAEHPPTPEGSKEFHLAGRFYAKDKNFFKFYRSVAVLPIRFRADDSDSQQGRPPHLHAFLCLDSPEPGSFDLLFPDRYALPIEQCPSAFNVLAAITDLLWPTFHLYIGVRPPLIERVLSRLRRR